VSALLAVLLAFASPAAAQRAVMEGVAAQRYTIKVDTQNARVLISTISYRGVVPSVGLYVSSNVVISSDTTDNAVIYATGSFTSDTVAAGTGTFVGGSFAQAITVSGVVVPSTSAVINPSTTTVQHVYTTSGTWTLTSAQIPPDDTIPQITEGIQVLVATITPRNVNNRLRIRGLVWVGTDNALQFTCALFQGTTADAIAVGFIWGNVAGTLFPCIVEHEMLAGTTSLTDFKVNVGGSAAANWGINGYVTGRRYGGIMLSHLEIDEIGN